MVFQAKSGVDVEKTVTDTQFKIATNSKLFSILSDSIYVRKIDAVIRELCCNAFDAHVEARQDRKFQVTLPSELNPEFRVRDFGAGLCEEDMQMYTTYGESTKSGSNAYIGAFGIGAKSPFAYTNTFNVTSYNSGIARAYTMFVENGVPRMTKIGEGPTDEHSGLEVFFPVAPKDIYEFKDKAIEICALMADKIEFLQVQDRWLSEFDLAVKKYQWQPADYLGTGYMTSDLSVDIRSVHNYLYIVQGNVKYEMSLHEVSEMLRLSLGRDYDKTVNLAKSKFYISGFLRVPNGTFVPHPSRERLTFDDLTKEAIKSIFQGIYRHYVIDSVDKVLDGVKSYYDLHRRIRDISRLAANNPRIIEFKLDAQNITTGPHLIHQYDDWRRFDFPCVQIVGGNDKTYRFKAVPQLNMFGDHIDRIYYTEKYPLSAEYRYRVLKDNLQSEAKNSIILFGNVSRIFTEDDKAMFVNVQALPKLTPQDLMTFKKAVYSQTGSAVRVTKEEASYLFVERQRDGHCVENFMQKPADKIAEMTADFPIYWVGSNKRYEIKLGEDLFQLKIQKDRKELVRQYLNFFIEYIAVSSPSAFSTGKQPKMGIVVLPENHVLRGILPDLESALQDGIRFTVMEFMNKMFFEINGNYGDEFFQALVSRQEVLLGLVSGKDGTVFKDFLEEWYAAKMPKLIKVHREIMPFGLLPSGECELLKDEYYSNKNIRTLNVNKMYAYIANNGFPLMERFRWSGVDNKAMADDLVDYFEFKIGRLIKDGN